MCGAPVWGAGERGGGPSPLHSSLGQRLGDLQIPVLSLYAVVTTTPLWSITALRLRLYTSAVRSPEASLGMT